MKIYLDKWLPLRLCQIPISFKSFMTFVAPVTLVILLLNPSFLQSQTFKKGTYTLGYLNESINRSGLIIGGEWIVKQWEKEKINKRKQTPLVKERAIVINPQIGIYHHKNNHTGLLSKGDITIRRNKKMSKWSHHWSAGLGAITQFNSGTTYVLKQNNEIQEKRTASRSYINPSISYSLERQIDSVFSVFTKIGPGIKVPYNTWLVPTTALVIGTKINFNRK